MAIAAILAVNPIRAAASDPTPAQNAAAQELDQALLNYQENRAEILVTGHATELLRDPMTQNFGNLDGDVAIIEFFDYRCPYCKAVEPKLRQLVQEDKRIKWVIKEFPVLSPESLVAAKAALASVKQGKYQAYHQAMMDFHGLLLTETIFDIAKKVGLDVERLKADMIAPEIADEIIANLNLARTMKISVVPGLIVGNHIYSGLTPKTMTGEIDFKAAVSEARAKKS
jgi:protein-disulfide isomerase